MGKTTQGKKETSARRGKKVKDPNAPKRGMTAFFHFMNEKRPVYAKENPTVKNTEVSKALSELWNKLSAEEKKPFEKKAAADKQRYEAEMKDYTPPPQTESEEPETKKKKKKDPDAPKKSLTSYMLFSKEEGSKIREGCAAKEAMSKIAEAWKNADTATKSKYEKRAAEDKKRADREKAEYDKKRKENPKSASPEEEDDEDVSEADSSEDSPEPSKKKSKKVAADDDSES